MNKQRKDRKEFIISNLINQQTLPLRGEKLKNNTEKNNEQLGF